MQTAACCAVWAPLLTEAPEPVYGHGIILGEFMNITHNYTYAEGSLYGDNRQTEYEKEPTGGDITLGVTWLPFMAGEMMFGEIVASANEKYTTSETPTRYGGLGYVKKVKHDGAVKYAVEWTYKTAFSKPNDAAQTKAGNIQFNTPSLAGKSLVLPNSMFTHTWEYDTLEEAINKAKELANVSDGSFVGQPYIFPENTAPITGETPITIVSNTPNAEIRYTTDGTTPGKSSQLYESPIHVSETTTVKAIAVHGEKISAVSHKTYTI